MSNIFKRTVLLSLLGHITVFSLFSFSFGNRIPQADLSAASFWGAILRNSDLMPRRQQASLPPHQLPRNDSRLPPRQLGNSPIGFNANWCGGNLKPTVDLNHNSEKMLFVAKRELTPVLRKRKEPVIMFYPHLPYHFLLYFQDRQTVHIELMFDIVSSGMANSVIIKRKISSGNLEADLLALRYIGHYLFIQQSSFSKNAWQTVKIDLSTKSQD